MDTMIDRYISTVSDLLPARQRKDTSTEIRSLIEDALDDRSKAEGRPPDDEMVTAVLKEFGPPEKIVAPYLPARYLVGPGLYPTFILVLRIALPIIAVLVAISSAIATSQISSMTTGEFFTSLAELFANVFSAVIQAFGNIVLIFAILQWTMPEFKIKAKEWDPHSLKAINKPDKIKRGEVIVEMVFTLFALIIFNFYLDRLGIYNNLDGQWSFTPILTQAFNAYVPWLSLLWALTLVLDILLLRKNSWDTLTRLFSILVNIFNIAISISLIKNVEFLYTLKGSLGQLGVEGIVESVLNQIFIIALVITIIASAIKIIQMALRLIRVSISGAENPSL